MPEVTYVLTDGQEVNIDVSAGQTVMDASVRNNIPGIVAECGGGCICATCRVYVNESDADLFDEPTDEERELLDMLDGGQSGSRLSCQLVIPDGVPSLRVTIADNSQGVL